MTHPKPLPYLVAALVWATTLMLALPVSARADEAPIEPAPPAKVPLEVSPRSAGGQTLEVPEKDLDFGQIFYLMAGQDSQITVTSKAPLQRIVAVSSRAVGYAATPFDVDTAEKPIHAGAIRLPVASLATGSLGTADFLRGPGFLDAAQFPEIVFEITGCQNVRPVELAEDEDDGNTFVYDLELTGRLGAIGNSIELKVPAKVTFLFSSGRTFDRYPGDMMILESHFELEPASLGWELPSPRLAERLAETLEVELYLLFNTISPDKSLDPALPQAPYESGLRFATLLRDLDDPEAAYAHGHELARKLWDDAPKLLWLVSMVVDDPEVRHRDLRFALDVALRADQLTGSADPDTLATVAKIYAEMGDAETAGGWQIKAIESLPEDAPPEAAAPLEAELARYREASAQRLR